MFERSLSSWPHRRFSRAAHGWSSTNRAISSVAVFTLSYTASVFGGGSREELESLVAKFGLDDTVFLCGHQENPYKFISRADALICSSYAEGYSTSVTEAVILGKPVITTECSGMREIFGDKECGIICENSEEGLFNAIKSILDNPEKLEEYARNSAERAKDFSIEKRIAELEEYLEKI